MEQKQTITLVVKNHPGVLLRITGLFTRRGFNIDSLTAFPDEKKEFTPPPSKSSARSIRSRRS